MVLGPILEENVRRSLILYDEWTIFLQRPISLVVIVISVFTLLYPLLRYLAKSVPGR